MSNGVVRSVSSDGLIVAKPRLYRPRFPLKGLLAVLFLGFLFKGFLFAYLGEAGYAERVAMDIEYLQTVSLVTDCTLIAKTAGSVMNRTGR